MGWGREMVWWGVRGGGVRDGAGTSVEKSARRHTSSSLDGFLKWKLVVMELELFFCSL